MGESHGFPFDGGGVRETIWQAVSIPTDIAVVNLFIKASTTFINRTDEFIVSLIGAWITILIVAALNPKRHEQQSRDPVSRPGAGAVVGALLLGLFLIPTLLATPAAADNCSSPADCYGTAGTLLIALGLLLLVVAVLATGGLAAVPLGLAVPVVGGLTALELTAAVLLLSGGTLIAADQIANSGGVTLGVPSPGPPRLPDPFPTGPLIGAAIAAVAGIVGAEQILGPQRAPPQIAENPDHYVDSQGNLRWRDTNQLVEQIPVRPKVLDNDGVERWADTGEPVDRATNHRPQLVDQWGVETVEFVESFGIDLTLVRGDLTEILKDVARQAADGDVGAVGELQGIARWQSEGKPVELPPRSTTDGVKNPDYLVDQTMTELKTRELPLSERYIKDRITKAAAQIKGSETAATGDLEIQLVGDAAEATFEELERQVSQHFTTARNRSLDRVAIYKDGELAGEWVRQADGSIVLRFRGGTGD